MPSVGTVSSAQPTSRRFAGASDLEFASVRLPVADEQPGAPKRAAIGPVGSVPVWKSAADVVFGVIALTCFAPVMALAAVTVLLTSRGPILFRQTRIGLGEQPFMLLKFRTMYVGRDDRAHRELSLRELSGDASADPRTGLYRLTHDSRVTPAGRFLRRFSIDELPQLFNVLRRDMSLVGPRPALPWEVENFTLEQRRRHTTLPGMTGLWQVSGRSRLSALEMLALDIEYVDRRTPLLDLMILLRTPRAIFQRGTC